MADAPNAIQILTTLEYLGVYSSLKYFGVVLQVGLGPTMAGDVAVDSSMANLLQPWLWWAPTANPPTAAAHPNDPIQVKPPDISVRKIASDATTSEVKVKIFPVAGSVDASITNQLSADCLSAIGTSNLGWTDTTHGQTSRSDGKNMYPWPAHLAQVARYPFPIPHLLNLCFLLQVTDESTLPTKGDVVFATVGFTTIVKGNPVTYTPQIADRFFNPDNRLVIPVSSDNTVFVTTNPLAIPPSGSLSSVPSIIPPASVLTPETTDWQVQLPTGSAEVFDLSARLVNSVRQACDLTAPVSKTAPDPNHLKQAVADSFNAFTATLIIAQREVLAYGCQSGSNGKSLLRRMLDQWVGTNNGNRDFATRFSSAVQNQRTADQKDTAAANNRWFQLLQKNPAFLNNSLIQKPPSTLSLAGPPPQPYDSTQTYKKDDVVLFAAGRFKALHAGKLKSPDDPNAYADWIQVITPSGINPANLSDRLLAIEHLQLQFTQPSILIQLLVGQWQTVFDASVGAQMTPADRSFLQSFLSSAALALTNLEVRGLLLQSNLGQSWAAITADVSSRDAIRANFLKEFNQRVTNLFNLLPGISPSTILGAPFEDWLAPWVRNRLTTLVPYPLNSTTRSTKSPQQTDNPQPTRAAAGLSVLVDGLDQGSGNDAADTLRSISGLCVLMRQAGASNPWRCLGAGIPIANLAQAPNTPAITNSGDPIVIPVPLHNQDGLRQATLTYNNQPMMSTSPAHGLSVGLVPTQTPSGNSARLISFQHPSVTQALDAYPAWKIPGLAFNRSYDFLLGRISNSGALPPEFADATGGPAVLSFTAVANATDASGKPLSPTIPSVPYRRTVPIADLRFASSFSADHRANSSAGTGSFDQLSLPAIPIDVHPRAQELFPTAVPSVGSTPDKPTTPLVLLTPYAAAAPAPSQFTLSVRKPTTDFLTWDRTQAGLDPSPAGTDSTIRKARTTAWQLFHTFARTQKSMYNLALEDPAIDSLMLGVWATWPKTLKSQPIGPAVADQSISWQDAAIADPATLPKRIQLQTASIDILITASPDANSAPSVAKSGTFSWTITLPPGSIAQIQLTPNLKAGMDQLFAPGILQPPKPYCVLVETANADLPQRQDLYNAFNVLPPTRPASNSVDFSLAAPPNSPAWLQVSRVDLQTQAWRWDGRPFHQFPYLDVARIPYDKKDPAVPRQSLTEKLLNWELEAFATRSASDSTTRPMTRVSAADPTFQAHDDRRSELGATYYRASVTAYNRYGSLVPATVAAKSKTDATVDLAARSSSSLNEFASVPGDDGNWTRRFIPARVSPDASVPVGFKPPKPAIKYIVPLTGSSTGSRPAASSALVVVQGPWFAIAGLAEDICVSITNSAAPREGSTDPVEVPEAGPDPILYRGPQSGLPITFDHYGSPFTPPDGDDPRFHGPVGHTFDLSDANPLWVTSSFVLDPPTSNGAAAEEGTFARVQFRRIIRQGGVVVQNVAPSDPHCAFPNPRPQTPALIPACGDFVSDSTDPVWVQFLPSRFLPYSGSFDNLVLNYASGSVTINIEGNKTPITLTLNPSTAESVNLVFGLLLTQLVPDLIGRPNQERFVDLALLKPGSDGKTTASWSFNLPAGIAEEDLIGRLVVIQRQVNTSTGCDPKNQSKSQPPCDLTTTQELWGELFPAAPANAKFSDVDAVARIVAVSPPIPASDSQTPNVSCDSDKSYATGD